MKKLHRFIALSLCTLSFATVGLSACKPNNGDEGKETDLPEREALETYNGTHIYTATDTSEYFVRNGKTEYKLVIPAESSSVMTIAQKEFTDLFNDATQIDIDVVTDDEVTDASSGKYVSLGRTKLLEDSGIVVDHDVLTNDGHRIVTKGDDVYICGGADEGTVFGVHTFMGITFNYETYAYDCMEIEQTSEKRLKNYDVTDIPDFKFRAHSTDVTTYDAPASEYDQNMYAWRLGYYGKSASRGYYYLPVHEQCDVRSASGASTNAIRWFPENIYKEVATCPNLDCTKPAEAETSLTTEVDNAERGTKKVTCNYCGEVFTTHSKWFSNVATTGKRGFQLCFSARGDAEEYEAMITTALERVKWTLTYYQPGTFASRPQAYIMTLTHMDNTNACSCSACSEIMKANGYSIASVQIRFMNELARRVDAWFEEEDCPGVAWKDSFKLLFFAYNHNYVPPAYYDAGSKTYKLYDESMRLHDRVIAWFCRENNGQEVYDGDKYFDEFETNKDFKSTIQCWKAVAGDNMHYWNYGTNYSSYMTPLDTFQYLTSEMMSFWCNQSDRFWFTQYQDNSKGPNSAWHGLKVYIDSQMSWNTSLEQGELVERWMKAMYKDAAPIMMELFLSQRTYHRENLVGVQTQMLKTAQSWPKGVLDTLLKKIDEAKEAVAHYKTSNPELYDEVCGHIELEAVSYIFLMLEIHGTISQEEKQGYVDRINYDIEWLNLHKTEAEGSLMPEWIAKYE